MSILNNIKNEIKRSGTNKGKFLYIKEGQKVRVRFLTDLEDAVEIPFHDSFKLGVNVPCQEVFGRDCEYCGNDDLRTRSQYVWCVYDYESGEVKLLMCPVNQCSPAPQIVAVYETYGTITDRDYEIKRQGSGQSTSYSVLPLEKKKFRNTKVSALSESAILKIIDKAYPVDDIEIDDDEDEKPKRNKSKSSKTKNKTKSEPEPEDDDFEEDEEESENKYDSMTPIELYKLCKKREIDCKPKKSKEYYIDLLEEADEESGEEWEDEDDDEWEE